MAFNGDYQQLANALLVQAGVAAGPAAQAAPVAVGSYTGDHIDIERVESSAQKWLSENCVDTNATVLQNVRTFIDHINYATEGQPLSVCISGTHHYLVHEA